MSEELNELLKDAYFHFKDHPNPPVPLKAIKNYLENQGIPVVEYHK